MKLIIGNAIVSCYADAASLLVMILLLFLSERIRDRQNKSARIFFLLCLQIAFTCVVCFVFNATAGHTSPISHTVAAVSRILWELCSITTDCLWLTYVDQKLYGDGRKKGRQYVRIGIIMVYLVLLIINVFTGMIYTLSDNNTLQRKPLFYLMMLAEFLLFFSAALSVWNYDRKTMKTRFLRITPMIVSMLLAVLPQFFTPYNLGIIGYVTGVTLLYFSMATEIRFVDRESGLYNKGYLAYLFDLALAQKNDIRSVLILEADGDLPALFGILRDVLHPQGDVIRTGEKKFMMFSAIDSRSTIEYLSSLVEDAVQKHNTEHPEAKIQVSARCRMRASGTESFEFLRTAM